MNFSAMDKPGHFSMNLDVNKIVIALGPFCKISFAAEDCALPITIETNNVALEAGIANVVALCLEDVTNFVTPPGWLESGQTMIRRKLHAVITELRQKYGLRPPSLAEQGCNALDTYIYGNPDHGDKEATYNTIRACLDRLKELEAKQWVSQMKCSACWATYSQTLRPITRFLLPLITHPGQSRLHTRISTRTISWRLESF
jgi:hypothetical protein